MKAENVVSHKQKTSVEVVGFRVISFCGLVVCFQFGLSQVGQLPGISTTGGRAVSVSAVIAGLVLLDDDDKGEKKYYLARFDQ